MAPSDQSGTLPAALDTSKPNVARAYDYLLGGKDSYAADREAVRQILRTWPEVRDMARANRAFMQRAVRFLAGEAGIRQFIDIGTGIPSAGKVHEVAGQVAPGARVVYVDNDPIVHVHASALLIGSDTTVIVLADLRDPGAPEAARADRFQPAGGLAAGGHLAFHRGGADPAGIVATLRDALPSGSYLTLSHGTADFHSPGCCRGVRHGLRAMPQPRSCCAPSSRSRRFFGSSTAR